MTICAAFHCTELVASQAARGAVHLGHVMQDGVEVEQADKREREGKWMNEEGEKMLYKRSISRGLLLSQIGKLEVVFRYSHLIGRQHG